MDLLALDGAALLLRRRRLPEKDTVEKGTRVNATTTLTLRRAEVSFLLGAIRNRIDEAEESLEEALDAEGVEFEKDTLDTFIPLERRLERALRRLKP